MTDHPAQVTGPVAVGDTVTIAVIAAPPPPPPPPVITPVASAPLVVTGDDILVSGKNFTGSGQSGAAIQAHGTPGRHIKRLTIRGCTATNFNIAVWAEYVDELVIEDNLGFVNLGYAGILALGGIGGSLARNVINHIGPQSLWKTTDGEIDAYGIALVHGAFTSDIRIAGNIIEDVPWWQGINAHNGTRITIEDNKVRRVRRAIWLAPTSADTIVDCIVQRNRVEQAVSAQPTALFISNSDGCKFIANSIDTSWPVNPDGGEWKNYVRDYAPASRNLVRSGNMRV